MVMSSRSALFVSRGWLSKSASASVVMSIRNGFSLLFCPLVLSLGRAMYLQQQTGLYSRKGIEPVTGEAHDCESESSIPSLCKIWRRCGWFLAGNHCHNISHQHVPPRHATPGSCLRFPSTGGSPSCLFARPPGIPQMSWRPPLALP